MRLARGITGRTKVVRFEGHNHGWLDNEFWNSAPPLDQAGDREEPTPLPASKGQVLSDAENLIIRPWNDLEIMKRTFDKHGGRIAAVLTEPIMCNCGGIMPRKGFLEGLRELCTRHGAVLIFDEVITGFRVSVGGAQEYFGVMPDVATFAKGMAGGFPVSAVAGRKEYMQAFGDGSISHAGTYNANGPCMAATLAAMETLSADGGGLLKQARGLGEQLMAGIAEAGRRAGKDVHIRGVGTAFFVSFNDREEIVDYRTSLGRDREAYGRFWLALQERGVRTIPEGLWFVSTAHTQEDVDRTLSAVAEAMKEV